MSEDFGYYTLVGRSKNNLLPGIIKLLLSIYHWKSGTCCNKENRTEIPAGAC